MIQIDKNSDYLYTYKKGEKINEIDFKENFFSLIDLSKLKNINNLDLNKINADTLILPKNLISLPESLLRFSCIKNIVFPEDFSLVDRFSFKDINTNTLDLSNTKLEVIAKNACYDNKFIKRVLLPKKDVSLKAFSFSGCQNLEEINLEDVISIGRYVFSSCTSIKEVYLNCAVAENAFHSCTSLKKVVLGNSFLCINSGSIFKDCSNLEKIIIDKDIENFSLEYLYKEYGSIIEINSIDNLIDKNKSFKEINNIYKDFER